MACHDVWRVLQIKSTHLCSADELCSAQLAVCVRAPGIGLYCILQLSMIRVNILSAVTGRGLGGLSLQRRRDLHTEIGVLEVDHGSGVLKDAGGQTLIQTQMISWRQRVLLHRIKGHTR